MNFLRCILQSIRIKQTWKNNCLKKIRYCCNGTLVVIYLSISGQECAKCDQITALGLIRDPLPTLKSRTEGNGCL